MTFAEEDVDVVAVVDGAQAIEAIAREAPDIVLADAGLPGTDGYDVASFIRNEAALARIPVVLLTGAFEPLDESRAASCGCRAVLVKPFAPRQVIDTVRELLGPAAGSATAATPSASAPVERDDAAGAPAESAPVGGRRTRRRTRAGRRPGQRRAGNRLGRSGARPRVPRRFLAAEQGAPPPESRAAPRRRAAPAAPELDGPVTDPDRPPEPGAACRASGPAAPPRDAGPSTAPDTIPVRCAS